jgi:hypothetical protein
LPANGATADGHQPTSTGAPFGADEASNHQFSELRRLAYHARVMRCNSRNWLCVIVAVGIAGLVSCGGETPADPKQCSEQTLGFSVAQFMAEIAGHHEAVLMWLPGPANLHVVPAPGTTTLSLDVAPDQKTTLDTTLCRLRTTATVKATTADGGLNESWFVAISAPKNRLVPDFTAQIGELTIQGTFRVTNLDGTPYRDLSFFASVLNKGVTSGGIFARAPVVATWNFVRP